MAISLTHTTSASGTDSADGKISKNAWNEAHTITMATGKLLGRQTASTGAVEELPLGWTQIGSTQTPSAVATVTFSSIPATYSDLLLVVEGVSHSDTGASRALQIQLSPDGTNFTAVATLSAQSANTQTWYGSYYCPLYTLNAGSFVGCVTTLASDLTTATPTSSIGLAWRINGGITAIRISWAGSANFDAGTLKLYGKI